MTCIQEFSENFTTERVPSSVFDLLKIMTLDETTFLTNMLTLPEIKRLRFRYCGLTSNYTVSAKKMIIAFFLIIKIFLSEILGFPLKFIKDYQIEPRKRL